MAPLGHNELNIKIYLHFLSFLNTEKELVVGNPSKWKNEFSWNILFPAPEQNGWNFADLITIGFSWKELVHLIKTYQSLFLGVHLTMNYQWSGYDSGGGGGGCGGVSLEAITWTTNKW